MQLIAREMNLSETAFVASRTDGSYDLRWFTPAVEVDLCGHATLATAHVLGGTGRFVTKSGLLTCTTGDDGWIEMDFPADPPTVADAPDTLGIAGIRWCGRGRSDLLVEVGDAATVRDLAPDLAAIAGLGVRCVVVTAGGDKPGIDCVSRGLRPGGGDPRRPGHRVGALHSGAVLGRTPREERIVGEQASPRGGIVRMRVAGERVILGGRAVTVSNVRMLV